MTIQKLMFKNQEHCNVNKIHIMKIHLYHFYRLLKVFWEFLVVKAANVGYINPGVFTLINGMCENLS